MTKHLYDELAERWYRTNNSSIWLYSDTHFGDEEMNNLRGITDEEQIRKINAKVGRHDTLILLGDVGDINYVSKLHGYKVLIMGNHDAGAVKYRRDSKLVNTYLNEADAKNAIRNGDITYFIDCDFGDGQIYFYGYRDNRLFDEVYEGPLFINEKIVLTHEPLIMLPYAYNIHGHKHFDNDDEEWGINVCAESINYTPVNINTIIKSGKINRCTKGLHRTTIDIRNDNKEIIK